MIFFPSHAFLQNVYEVFAEYFMDEDKMECLLQEEYMNEQSREIFLTKFSGNSSEISEESLDLSEIIHMEIDNEEKTLIGFCVLGGIFSEGIDLKNDSLIGAIIVGTGLPQVCNEREILKHYFDRQGDNGFDFAYKYPGMNKVLQAAGRVIRTVEDVGIVALLDERFLTPSYLRMFPREWEKYERVSLEQVDKRIECFWKEWS